MRTVPQALERVIAGSPADEVEHDQLDFKRQSDSRNDTVSGLADAAVCFANATGGTVVLGVADNLPGADALLGTDLDPAWVRRRIYEKTQPSLDVMAREFEYESVRLLEIVVQEGLDVYQVEGKAPRRRFQKSCLPMSTSDVARLHEERRGSDWSATDSGRPVADIDAAAELLLRSMTRSAPANPRDISAAPIIDLLQMLALVNVSGTLTHAGDLLLCAPLPSGRGEVLAYQFRDTAGGEVRTGRRWEPPILVAFSEAMATIEARVGTNPVNLPAGRQIQIEDYPLVAVREAIANGLTHGEHRDRRPVLVEHSPELLQVHSPGPLVSGISPSNILTHPPKPRFPSLAEAMRACGLGEKWGKGIDRMYREMIRSGRSAPVVQVSEGDTAETTVRFTGGPPNVRIAKFIASLPAEEQDDTDTLLVVAALATKRNLNAEQLAPLVQRDVDAAQSVLTRLANGRAELVEPTPRSARRRYPDYRLRSQAIAALGPALAYQSRPRADSDQKISAHVREYGSINNAAVQRMLDVDVYAARDVLRDLVDRGVVVRISEQSRGTAVKYGPGPKFPRGRGGPR